MYRTILLAVFTLALGQAQAQKYLTREGYIKFYGSTAMENIEATTKQASSVIDASNNAIVFQVLLNSFGFEKALMQEHFNENYVESEKYPKAVFKGKIEGDVDYGKPGTYDVMVKGNMNLHGVDKTVETKAKVIIEDDDVVKLSATFKLVPEEYDIAIPDVVREKIAKEMEVTVKCKYNLVK